MSDLEIYHRNPSRRTSKPLDLVLSVNRIEQLGPPADPTAVDRSRAARFAATNSRDAAECAEFLDMLGLDPAEGKS